MESTIKLRDDNNFKKSLAFQKKLKRTIFSHNHLPFQGETAPFLWQ